MPKFLSRTSKSTGSSSAATRVRGLNSTMPTLSLNASGLLLSVGRAGHRDVDEVDLDPGLGHFADRLRERLAVLLPVDRRGGR